MTRYSEALRTDTVRVTDGGVALVFEVEWSISNGERDYLDTPGYPTHIDEVHAKRLVVVCVDFDTTVKGGECGFRHKPDDDENKKACVAFQESMEAEWFRDEIHEQLWATVEPRE